MNKIILNFIRNDKGTKINNSKKDKVGGTDTTEQFGNLQQYWRGDRQTDTVEDRREPEARDPASCLCRVVQKPLK